MTLTSLFPLLLTGSGLYALFRLGDPDPAAPPEGAHRRTAYIPLTWRRVWTVAAFALSLLTWLVPQWPVILAAMAAHLGVLVCRHARIVWDQKQIRITTMLGLTWEYEYAQVQYLPGRLPFIRAGGSVYLLWPGLVWRDTFLAEARERVRVAAYAQKYRKRAYKSSRQNAASCNALLANIGLALALIALTAYMTWPVNADSGEVRQLVLQEATQRRDSRQITLDFGASRQYRIPLNDSTAPLLEEDALGQTYTVQRQYRASASRYTNRGYYDVLAMTGEDGAVYRTWQESNAARTASRIPMLAFDLVTWFVLRRTTDKRRKS